MEVSVIYSDGRKLNHKKCPTPDFFNRIGECIDKVFALDIASAVENYIEKNGTWGWGVGIGLCEVIGRGGHYFF
jgi:hypothetical protein